MLRYAQKTFTSSQTCTACGQLLLLLNVERKWISVHGISLPARPLLTLHPDIILHLPPSAYFLMKFLYSCSSNWHPGKLNNLKMKDLSWYGSQLPHQFILNFFGFIFFLGFAVHVNTHTAPFWSFTYLTHFYIICNPYILDWAKK